jgi:hypothetical protein
MFHAINTEYRVNVKIDILMTKKFEDTKGVIRSYLSKDRQYTAQKKNDKKDKQRFTKEYTEMNKHIAAIFDSNMSVREKCIK